MGLDVRIDVDRSESGGTFTNHDVIRGEVRLTTTQPVSLSYIQVKLEGVASTQLTVPKALKKKKEKDREKLLQDVHKVLYDSAMVFPPENVRNVSNSREFTLNPGDYKYPFSFKIPLNNSCVKTSGITNKISFSRDSRQILVNNGNFSASLIKNVAQNYFQVYPQNDSVPPEKKLAYHVNTQLPPSISNMGSFATVRYYVKVTCKRSSVFKTNLRAFDPFTFLPLDLDSHNRPLYEGQQFEEFREVFFRKEMVFKNRIPEIVGIKMSKKVVPVPTSDLKKSLPSTPPPPQRKGFFSSFINSTPSPPTSSVRPPSSRRSSNSTSSSHQTNGAYEISATKVPFSFEIRFKYKPLLVPSRAPTFRLYLLSPHKPARYSLAQHGLPDESNGLGVIYLQKLTVELRSTTNISVLETDGAGEVTHQGKSEEVIQLCNNSYKNVQFDLCDAKPSRSSSATSTTHHDPDLYELEIPRKYFDTCLLPDGLAPSFKTCNITRKYSLVVVAGFSSEKVKDFKDQHEIEKKVRYIDLHCPEVQVLSGLRLTSWLHSNASGSNISKHSDHMPPLPNRPSTVSLQSEERIAPSRKGSESRLPTYDDVVRENSYQDDSEHLRARQRYQSGA